ncbi:DUF262 domain-containing protein [Streptococcus suis]|uniref:DUF262 domain-containing protein n=1 Tax=Streptococcus suis TaxID=1307 RepID=UPI000CF5CAF0|nr:DUF262 domain-containing protein [Streptococcus suis]MDG4508989.1 DUF262 domain-containing protein [Streptococcus suis]HEM6181011.1 DUF262 domain-containing protein [Streptococcus suis]
METSINRYVKPQYSRPLVTVQDVVNFIEKGEKYKQNLVDNPDTESSNLDYLYGIILTPDYQRGYRSNNTEESSIIESLILGIPIPEVFLVKTSDEVQLRHVMDGQHRLTAIYRFVKNEFALRNLEVLDHIDGKLIDEPKYEKKRFSDLDNVTKIQILGSNISILQFDSFDDSEMEIELFKRYNKNSKPLEPQEIAMATYFSKTSQYISQFITFCFSHNDEKDSEFELPYTTSELDRLSSIYNITKIRKEKQKNHRELCIIFNILENGVSLYDKKLDDGVKLATDYLKGKSEKFKKNISEDLESTKDRFFSFNRFVLKLSEYVEMPISVQLLNDYSVNTRYHVGVSMTLALVHHVFDIDLESTELLADVSSLLSISPVGDPKYRASTTNIRTLINYLFKDKKVHCKTYQSLKIKTEMKEKIEYYLENSTSV